MRKVIIILLLSMFLTSFIPAYAQEETTDNADAEVEQVLDETLPSEDEVGLTPDKTGYGLKIAMERLRLALIFNKERRAKLALQLADKRVEEAKLMANLNKLEALQRAREEHRRLIQKVRTDAGNLDEEDVKTFETHAELESEIETQEKEVNELENVVLIRAKGLTEEQRQEFLDLVESFRNDTSEIKIKFNERKEELRVKLKDKGFNETDLEEREAKFLETAERFASHEVEQAEKMFNLASGLIGKSSEKNFTIKQETLDVKTKAEEKLNEAKAALINKEYKKTVELAREAKKLSALVIASIHGLQKDLIAKRLENLEKQREKLQELKEKAGEKRKKIQEELEERLKSRAEKAAEETESDEEETSENSDDSGEDLDDTESEDSGENESDSNRSGSNSGY